MQSGPCPGPLERGRAWSQTHDLGHGLSLQLHGRLEPGLGLPPQGSRLPAPSLAVTWEGATTSSSLDSVVVSSTKVSLLEGAGPTGEAQVTVGNPGFPLPAGQVRALREQEGPEVAWSLFTCLTL